MTVVTGMTVRLVFQTIGEVLTRTGVVPILPGPLVVPPLLLLPPLRRAPVRAMQVHPDARVHAGLAFGIRAILAALLIPLFGRPF